MAVRDDRSDVKQTTTGFRGPLMVQSLTSAKSKFLSLNDKRKTSIQLTLFDALAFSILSITSICFLFLFIYLKNNKKALL